MNVEELLPAYVTGELTPEEREQVLIALAHSAELREQLAQYQRLVLFYLLANEDAVPAPSDLSSQILRRVMLYYYLNRLTNVAADIIGVYRQAIVYYLGLR
jgi:anti-sigma factor RsiW